LISDGVLRSQISDFEIDEEIFELTIQRITDEAKTGNNSGALSSFFKYYGTELNIKRQELLMAVTGTDSLIWEENEKSDGDLARKFCRSKGNSIEGGTSEIQLNIISKLILGLPTK
jgi:acyl-CoA dehydrogenase